MLSRRTLRTLAVVGLLVLVATPVYGDATKSPLDARSEDVDAGSTGVVVGVQFEDVERITNATRHALDPPSKTTYFSVTPRGEGILTSYAAQAQHCKQDTPCTGFKKVFPANGTTDWEWNFSIPKVGRSEVHDVEPIGDDRYLFTDMVEERIAIYDRSADAVTWEWHGEQYYDDPPEDYETGDWLHINDVDEIADGRYMVSVRNKNQILFVDRHEGVIDVINEDGNASLLFHQHNPQWLGPGEVLVADSENDRVVELHRADGSWEIVWSVYSAGDVEFNWPRDADRLPNGNTLITDSRNNRIVEMNESKAVLNTWGASVTPYEADRIEYGDEINAVALPTYGEGNATGSLTGSALPLRYADLAHAGIIELVDGVPYWFNPIHVLVMSGGFLLVLVYPLGRLVEAVHGIVAE